MPVGIIRLLNTEPISSDTNVLYLDNDNKLNFKNNSSKGTIIANLQLDNINQIQKNEIKTQTQTQTTSINLINDFTLNNVNTTSTNNIISKISGGSATNASVYSTESYTGSTYLKFKVLKVNLAQYYHIGFSTDPTTNSGHTSIDYQIYFNSNSALYIGIPGVLTSSHLKDPWISPVINDIFEIIYEGTTIEYYKNSALIHREINVPENQTFYLDSSIYLQENDIFEILEFSSAPNNNVITNNLEIINTSNNSFTFNGTSDYLEIPSNISPQLSNSDFTIEFYGKFVTLNNDETFCTILHQGINDSYKDLEIRYARRTGGGYYFAVATSAEYGINDYEITNIYNNWHHYAITYKNGSTMKLYIDGIQQTLTDGNMNSITLRDNINIGKHSYLSNRLFKGELKHLRVYNSIKYSSNFSVNTTEHTVISNPYSTVLNSDLLLYIPMINKQNIIYNININNTLSNNNTLHSYQNELYFENGKVITENSQTAPIRFKNNYVGIGTKNPEYPLHVIGTGGVTNDSAKYLQQGMSNTNVVTASEIHSITIYTEGNIYASGLIAASDNRIKTNIEELVDNEALIKFRQLKPCKYNYIDTITRTSEKVYGFIAQEVRETLPYATSITEEYIPNIYKLALYKDTVITFDNEHNLESEGNIKLIKPNNTEIIVPYVIIDTHKINIITSDLSSNEILSNDLVQDEDGNDLAHNIFVYGTNVNDFHTLNKDAIWTTATAALQEVDKIQQEDNNKINNLESENTELKDKVSTLENKIPLLMDKVENILNKLLILESN